jgi:hypothetical protein
MSESTAITQVPQVSGSIYLSEASFDFAQRQARMLAESSFVPREFKGQAGLSNCVVAVGVARRMGMDPTYVCQSINVINGRPSWKSEFISGAIQGCGRFTDFGYAETEDSCQVVCKRADSGEEVRGVKITLEMAKAEGWTRNTKWRSMPQRMLRARAVSFFGRDYIPDILNGMSSVDEAEVIEADIKVAPSTPEDKLDKVASLLAPKTDPVPVPEPEPASDVIEPDDFFD